MKESDIREYFETNLKSHPNDICDSSDRLVWISEVIKIANFLLNQKQEIKEISKTEFIL